MSQLCAKCGKEFVATSERKIYCSVGCQINGVQFAKRRHKAVGSTKHCEQCGKAIPSFGRGRPRKYCGPLCLAAASPSNWRNPCTMRMALWRARNQEKYATTYCKQQEKRAALRQQEKLTGGLVKNCPQCNATFRTTNKQKKYCTIKCGRKAFQLSKLAKPQCKTCTSCGVVFETKYPKKQFCSKRCVNNNYRSTNPDAAIERKRLFYERHPGRKSEHSQNEARKRAENQLLQIQTIVKEKMNERPTETAC